MLKLSGIVTTIGIPLLLAACGTTSRAQPLPCERSPCAAQNQRIESMRIILDGARPHFSPSGDEIVFDRLNADGYSDVYVSDLDGNVLRSLTDGKDGIPQRNNGNGVFDPSGASVIFVSEAAPHFADEVKNVGDSGVGLFSNLWATDLRGSRFWMLTDVPIKQKLTDGVPAYAVVNPRFSRDGKTLIWTERYAEGGHHHWGEWRLKGADYLFEDGIPRLENTRTLFEPQEGNYVTFMSELPSGDWILAGNLSGQHEYGMDQYRYDPQSAALLNLQNSPQYWEEDASVSPASWILYMTNVDSAFTFDFEDANWARQAMERDYYRMDSDGNNKERLTFFNDPSAPEYLGYRALAVASDFSPDGKLLAGTIGVDFSPGERRNVVLKIVLIRFREPW